MGISVLLWSSENSLAPARDLVASMERAYRVLHVVNVPASGNSINVKNFVSCVERKDAAYAGMMKNGLLLLDSQTLTLLTSDINGSNYASLEYLLLLCLRTKKHTVVVTHDECVANWIKAAFAKAAVVTYLEEIVRSGHSAMLTMDLYRVLMLRAMGGNNELEGYNRIDGVMQLFSRSQQALDGVVHSLSAIRDVLTLDVSVDNTIRWCHNQCLPGLQRLNLAAVLIPQPEREEGMYKDKEGMWVKQYVPLEEQDWMSLMDAMSGADYPYVVATKGEGGHIPQSAIDRSTHVVQVTDDVMILRVIKHTMGGE